MLRVRWVAILLLACGAPVDPDAGPSIDAAQDDAGPLDAALLNFDGTPELAPCDGGMCAPREERLAGRWRFHFACLATSIWRVTLDAASEDATLSIIGGESAVLAASDVPGPSHELMFTSRETVPSCTAIVVLPRAAAFELAIIEVEPALDDRECDELCIADSTAAVDRGCDCARTCHDACRYVGTDCGLPCNRDVPGYDCPFREADIIADPDCEYYEDDTGSFEHVGTCYRCGDGNQCCYTGGNDNGTGSFDLCPPLDPGEDDPDPNGCSGVFEHCDCDVTTLCGCMAESGNLALCGECIGEGNFELSCNAPGDDATFCRRAADAATAGFSWCERVGDIARCFDRPPGF
jgi:hypothetical protein